MAGECSKSGRNGQDSAKTQAVDPDAEKSMVDVRDCMHDGDEAGCGAVCFALSAEVLPTVTPALQCRGRAIVFE